ncbi:hypothetical_protein [Candidozyma auris]|uniref:hypothetical_protein n=1 Tax=Candidozyma auris TaxID=498019 RepID=UPI000D2AECB7|nr:hypothetical_protein [[Candida] auris]QEO24061.1 hypothetical_protein [[Candida] auris]GBL52696.1 putative aminopeptidase N [[Candida] auris]
MPSELYYEALPSQLKPIHYDLSVFDLNLDNDTYNGVVVIDLQVVEETDELHLHYRDLKIGEIKVKVGERSIEAKVASIDEKKEFFVVKFSEQVFPKDEKIQATITYSGIIQTNMAGLYKSSYKENGETKYMMSTQFEATDARRAFPCMDEPALKATFVVHITSDAHYTVLGNTPVEKVEEKGDKKITSFQKTPIMSTYLLAWALGELEYIEGFTEDKYFNDKPLPVRIYTTNGYTKDAEFALSLAPRIVDYFSKIFEIKYPLPKLDLLAVHSFSHNAMENWGLITYRFTALLYNPDTSDPEYKQKVAYVVAHEIAHQWFGNLVTMQWWDELWLNEGFATWVGYAAVDYLFPEWDMFSAFASSSLQTALKLDGLRNSHPIKVPVVSALEIDQLFDQISYLKGASTILMLSAYLGTGIFLKGVAHYLNANKYGNATSLALWKSLSETSGHPVAKMMDSWINKIGFPVINVEQEGKNLVLKQSRFLNGGGVKPEDDQTVWWVPLNACGDNVQSLKEDIIDKKVTTIENYTVEGFFKLNQDSQAVIRVDYSPDILQNNVFPYFDKLSSKDKVGVIADVASIAMSGNENTDTITFLELVKSIVLDSDKIGESYVAWLELCSRLSSLKTTFSGEDEELSENLVSFIQKVYAKLAVKLLSEQVEVNDVLKAKLKAQILNSAATYHVPEVKQMAETYFDGWKQSKIIDPAMRYFTFSSILSSSAVTEDDVKVVMDEVINPSALDSREVALSALGNISSPELAKNIISTLTDINIVPVMDAHFLAGNISKNTAVRDLLWEFIKENYSTLHKLMSTNMVVLDRFIRFTLGNYQSEAMADDVEAFFKDRDVNGFERSLSQVLDYIRINAAWFKRDHVRVKEWLTKNNF